jgi:hypothetical protein
MIPFVLYLGFPVLAAMYLGWRRSGLVEQKSQSWESLIGRLRDCNGRELSPQFLWREGLSAGPEETWNLLGGLRGLWSLYSNARVMMEMAEFAARHGGVDAEMLDTLRCNATQIRLCVITVAAEYLLHQADEGVRMQTFRAASVYTGMAARMAELLRRHARTQLPQFVAAM